MQRLLQVAKWLWMILIVAAVIWYLTQNFADVFAALQQISLPRLIGSSLLLLIGRLLMMQLVKESLVTIGYDKPFFNTFQMVSLTELGKYLPGGIWHFVGRATYYRQEGLSIKDTTRALFLENLWLVISSAFAGCILLLIDNLTSNIFFLIVPFLALWLTVIAITLRQTIHKQQLPRLLYLLLLHISIWLVLGLSYWVLLPEKASEFIWLILGAFAISWLAGFVNVLSPGGLGTREAVITALMLPVFAAETTLILASIHRLLWIGFEILMFLIAIVRSRQVISTPIDE
jgi:uncharacterized membrane protein YbhN (UPF0104 family)